jgi:hypothetical protein
MNDKILFRSGLKQTILTFPHLELYYIKSLILTLYLESRQACDLYELGHLEKKPLLFIHIALILFTRFIT